MGTLRILLASLVLASHSGLLNPQIGGLAVESFFVISGFYIQMILREKYIGQPGWRGKFLKSRMLRIFVPYWTVLIGTVVIMLLLFPESIGKRLPMFALLSKDPSSRDSITMSFSNIFIIGQDYFKVWRMVDNEWKTYREAIIIPPAWSISLELMFYILAPWLLACRTRVLVFVTALSLMAKFLILATTRVSPLAYECGDGLVNGIFPLELGLFTAGSLCYRYYAYRLAADGFEGEAFKWRTVLVASTVSMILVLTRVNPILFSYLIFYYTYVLFLIIVLPFIFAASRSNRWDRRLGELSYPFYLCAFPVATDLLKKNVSLTLWFPLAEVITLCLAYLIMRYVEDPLTRFRHRRFYAASPSSPYALRSRPGPVA